MILIRADANEIIGTGHVMRCLSTARAISDIGEEVAFVLADERPARLIDRQGYETICLNSVWTNMESERMDEVALKYDPRLIIVDSYYVTEKYLSNLKHMSKTAYFDDMNSQCWDVDYLINYNIFADTFNYAAYDSTDTKLLLGPKYAPLREEFRRLPRHSIKSKVSDILVSAGGVDPEGIILRLIKSICPKYPNIGFHFIVGELNPSRKEIEVAAQVRNNAVLHINEAHMSRLMMSCDIAVAAAGTTLYELCAAGIPTITYSLADNQIVATEEFGRQKLMRNIGDCRNNSVFISTLDSALSCMLNDSNIRRVYSEKMQSVVDGLGSVHLANELIGD